MAKVTTQSDGVVRIVIEDKRKKKKGVDEASTSEEDEYDEKDAESDAITGLGLAKQLASFDSSGTGSFALGAVDTGFGVVDKLGAYGKMNIVGKIGLISGTLVAVLKQLHDYAKDRAIQTREQSELLRRANYTRREL